MGMARISRSIIAMSAGALLAGCSLVLTPPPSVTDHISGAFTTDRLVYCFGHDCAHSDEIAIPPEQWREIATLFPASDIDAPRERAAIRTAIGRLERVAGAQAGTMNDKAGTIPFAYDLGPPQLDCYDETINTSNFLGLLERAGLLRYHQVRPPVQRAFVNGDIIHATAVIRDLKSGRDYAVDSSFHDNGEDAETVPLDAWLAGWAPSGVIASVSD